MTDECANRGGRLNAKPEAPEPTAYDPVYELATLVATVRGSGRMTGTTDEHNRSN